jgi:hypothetical protein
MEKGPPAEDAHGGGSDPIARALYDLALALREDKLSAQVARWQSMSRRWFFYGPRHPETTASLAFLGDFHRLEQFATPYWALALEAIAGHGSRYAIMKAELLRRIGLAFLERKDHALATAAFREADSHYRACRPDDDPERLDLVALLAKSLFRADYFVALKEISLAIERTLAKAGPRLHPDPRLSSDDALLAMSLAGRGAATVFLGEDAKATELVERASDIRSSSSYASRARRAAERLIDSRDAPEPARLLARAARLRAANAPHRSRDS